MILPEPLDPPQYIWDHDAQEWKPYDWRNPTGLTTSPYEYSPTADPVPYGATGDQLPPGCTCTHFITVVPPEPNYWSPGNPPPPPSTKRRNVCDKIQCKGTSPLGSGCFFLQVIDELILRSCQCERDSGAAIPIQGHCKVPPGDFAPPTNPVAPPGVKCGWPPGGGPKRYGFRRRTYNWIRCGYNGNPNYPMWPDGQVVPPKTAQSTSAGPVSTYDYVNMVYHGFYGGTSLQSQELNELQENIQNQLSLSNKLTGNWLEYNNNSNIHGETLGGIYTAYGLTADIFIPLDPKNITENSTTTHNDWYLYKDNHGYEQFIVLQGEAVSHLIYYNNIESRIVSSQDPNWAILRDTSSSTFDGTGAHRIQLFYNPNSTQ